MSAAEQCGAGVRNRVQPFVSRNGDTRYTIGQSIDGKPWFTLRGQWGRVRVFHTEAAALRAIAAAQGVA